MTLGPPTWSDIAAGTALVISLVSLWFSWRDDRRANDQERRRRPSLIPTLLNGFFRINPEDRSREYAFYLSISNPTDTDNSIATVDLEVTYLTQANVKITVKVRADEKRAAASPYGKDDMMAVPRRVAAHDTASGWCYFRIDAAVLEGARVEGYRVALRDSHKIEASVEPMIVQEYRDEIPAPTR